MICNELQEDLALMAAGALGEPRLALVREHVRGCPGCAARLREYESVCAAHARRSRRTRGVAGPIESQVSDAGARWLFSNHPWRWLIPIAGSGSRNLAADATTGS